MAVAGPIVVDARPLQGPSASRGVGTYVRGLVRGLGDLGPSRAIRLLVDGAQPVPDLPFPTVAVRRRSRGLLAAYEDAAVMGGDLARLGAGLFHATSFLLPGSAPCPVVATVHDLIPWARPAGMFGQRVRYAPARRLLGRADRVLAVSEASAGDARRLARVRRERITVVPEAASPSFAPRPGAREAVRERWGVDGPFFLFVGALDRRKDPAGLQQAWLTARRLGAAAELVVAGDPGRQSPGPIPRSRPLGRVSDDELADLYSAATALLFPSRYEGFGLPILEAMACGCPVIAYRNSSIPEVAGEAAVLVGDGDSSAMGSAAAEVYGSEADRRRLREAGLLQAARFSWARTAELTYRAYEALLA